MNTLFSWIMIGFLFGMGFELASWVIDYIMQSLGFALG